LTVDGGRLTVDGGRLTVDGGRGMKYIDAAMCTLFKKKSLQKCWGLVQYFIFSAIIKIGLLG
jgi:hypothetical protein